MKSLRDFKTVRQRKEYLEKLKRVSLKNIGSFTIDEKMASVRNCENMVGVAQVPMGVAGPLKIRNSKFEIRNYYIPLATTEGALIASVNRGCKAVNESGGIKVIVENIGATRGSIFETDGITKSTELKSWFEKNLHPLRKIAESTSHHLILKKTDVNITGKIVFVRFYYDTQDAMGLNMITIATDAIIPFIEKETKAKCISVAGNFDIDKKPAWLNFISGRGKRVWAEAVINKKLVASVLKAAPEKLVKVAHDKYLLGSIMSGSLGFNGHYANIIAAIFIATGQDAAHVVEGSLGITTTELTEKGDLYISVYLPDLMLGTIGGGTGLETQKEALQLLGVCGGNNGKNSLTFAEIVGGAVLAGELSLLASLSEGTLAQAHRRLGRGEKI